MSRATLGWSLLCILLVALALRLWRIDSLPPGFHLDESFEGLEAWRILTDSTYRPLFAGNFGVPPLNAYANAGMFALFQLLGGAVGPVAMRVTAAVFGLLGVWAVYGVARELAIVNCQLSIVNYSARLALFAAAALAVMRWHLHFSRMGIEPIVVPLLWAASHWLLLRGWRTGGWINFTGCGVVLALCIYTYQGAWVIPLLAGAWGIGLLVQEYARLKIEDWPLRNLSVKRVSGLLLAGVVALLLFAPLGWFFWQNRELVFLRPIQLTILGNTTSPADDSLGHAAWATLRMFWPLGATGDLDVRRNLPGAPALNLWLAIPFWLGLGVSLWRIRQPASALILLGWVGLLLPGAFSEYAPHFHRILGASAPTALLIAVGLESLVTGGQWLGKKLATGEWRLKIEQPSLQSSVFSLRIQPWLPTALCWLLLMLGGMVSIRDYFGRWAALPALYYAFDVGLWQLGQQIAATPAEMPVYLSPRPADHPTLAFTWRTQPNAHPPPVTFDGRHIFPLTAQLGTQPERYAVVEAEDFRTRLLLPELFPNATIQQEFLDEQGKPYPRIYERPAHSTPQRPPRYSRLVPLGDGITLLGYDLLPAQPQPGEPLYLQLHWRVAAAPTANWTTFTHVVSKDAAGKPTVVAGFDSQPGAGSLPTTRWQAGWLLLDEYQIPLPAELAPGDYDLEIGLYSPSGTHLPAEPASVVLGSVHLE